MERRKLIQVLCVGLGCLTLGLSDASAQSKSKGDSVKVISPRVILPSSADDISREASVFSPRRPSNLTTRFEYDPRTNLYLLTTYLGEQRLGTPIPYTPAEFMAYMAKRSDAHYFGLLNRPEEDKQKKKGFNPLDMEFGIGPAERIFGPGGVKLRLQGSAELSAGIKSNATDNPSVSERARRNTFFDFDEKIQAGVQASVGNKLNFNLNYNTASTFDFDSKKLKLAFEGEEDDIVKLIEAGNVSMQPKNSLINGGGALFGVHSKMQFGKLTLDMLVSQQRTQRKRIATKGGAQTTSFELSAANYDENRHFFLGDFFRQQYNEALSSLPYVRSAVKINRIEVWVTNKRGRYDDARNVVAFADLGDARRVHNPSINITSGGALHPRNSANDLYSTLNADPELRRIDQVTRVLSGKLTAGSDYDKLESARRLGESEYDLNASLGYITLSSKLQSDEVLAVAYEYTYNGQLYRVGEFSSDRPDQSTDNLFVKLIKGSNMSPNAPYWENMMRNVYSLGAGVYNLQAEGFRLDVLYRSDGTGSYVPYLPSGSLKGQRLLEVLGLDKINQREQQHSDGRFDYVEGLTVNANRGLIYFPSVEPFGQTLVEQNAGDEFVYRELYTQTKVKAQQVAEKNKYILRGEYKASGSGEIALGAMNVTPGTVRVTAGGVTLQENVDYTVDYLSGVVKIINTQIQSARTPVEVSLEDSGGFGTQRKTMLGLDLGYQLTPQLQLGATAMYLSELPLTTKTNLGDESMQNFLWGTNLSWRTKSQWLTNMLDKLPLLDLTTASQISLDAEFAHLIPGHYESRYAQGNSYLDDFESSRSEIDLMNPYAWSLASVPYDASRQLASPSDYLATGYDRALLSWYNIDPIFTRERSSLTPSYIRNNPELVSNHFVREVEMRELFPYRDLNVNQVSFLQTLNLSFYPQERGPYNLGLERMLPSGLLDRPEESWGGIMRKIDQSDFEASNVEYLEFWLMDPFVHSTGAKGGDLYFNLGDISEDILKDEKKFFENGIPLTDDPTAMETTVWGRVPRRQSVGYSFDNAPGARAKQDVGFNGLTTAEEQQHESYKSYIDQLKRIASGETLGRWAGDPFSPINDPGGDNFHHYRGDDFDAARLSILDRYKYYNGVEGNSAEATGSSDYSVASRVAPDVEDINQDNNLNELDRYYEYKISLRPEDLRVGQNYIVASREADVRLRNGENSKVTWYQFKVPLSQYTSAIGGISDLRSMRFMRIYLKGFAQQTNLRFGALHLVRGDWRLYDQPLHGKVAPITKAQISVSAVNIEADGDRTPINYVLPPGVPRSLDAQQTQSTQLNEQSLSLKLRQIAPDDARAIYRNTSYDLRRYRRLQLFVHAEQLVEDNTNTQDGDISVFVRLGSDYRNNYYEYSVPLKLTQSGRYNGYSDVDQRRVWPDANFVNIDLDGLIAHKRKRNEAVARGQAGISLFELFSQPDPDATNNSISILGNPSLSNVRTIMIGLRNNSGEVRSVEVWVNELRVGDYHEEGGWAANANLAVQLSDLGAFNLRGQMSTAGFGAIDQSLSERQIEDRRSINLSTNLELGKFFPEKAKVSIPVYYNITDEQNTPQYNPMDEDVKLKDALESVATSAQRDSIMNYAIDRRITRSLSLSNINVGIRSKEPMPYDPANLSANFSHNFTEVQNPQTEYLHQINWQAGLNYDFSPQWRSVRPFASLKGNGSLARYLKQYGLNLWPSRLNLQTSMIRSYEEEQLRNHIDAAGDTKLPVSFSQQFVWYRKLNLNWNLTPNLIFTLATGTDARIEEPHVQVNRELNPDAYAQWKYAVDKSIKELGTPMRYAQTTSLTYTLPTSAIEPLNWINAQGNYSGAYNWTLGAELPKEQLRLPNVITNQMNLELSGQLRLKNLYAKSKYLKGLELKFNSNSSSSQRKKEKPKPKSFVKTLNLLPDSTLVVAHGLGTKRMRIVAKDSTGLVRPIKTELVDDKTIKVFGTDSSTLTLTLTPEPPKEMNPTLRAIIDRSVYTLLMVKDVSLSYRHTGSTHLPGFLPSIGAALGQNTSGVMSPGVGFALGFTDEDYIDRAAERGWLSHDQQNVQPAVVSRSAVLDIKATIQPIRDLNISLSANHTRTDRTELQYMYEGRPRLFGGDFVMTTIGLKGIFSSPEANSGYRSAQFDRFLASRDAVVARLKEEAYGDSYPNQGFLAQGGWAGQAIGEENIQVDRNASAVLIPAFRSAYTQSSGAGGIDLDPLPDLLSMLPNWNVTYNGLNKIEALKKLFSNVTLRHAYRGTYRVDNYTSFPSWVGDRASTFGYVPDQASASGKPRLSLPYDIASISIQESFFPLLGVDITLENGLTLTTQWRRNRSVTLNLSAFRLIETSSNELNLGASYKIADIKALFSPAKAKRKRRGSSTKGNTSTSAKGLNLRADYSYRHNLSLIRKIQDDYTQANSGNVDSRLSLSAEYDLSRMLALKAYFEWTSNRPLVSASAFPVRNTAFGVSLRFNLTQ